MAIIGLFLVEPVSAGLRSTALGEPYPGSTVQPQKSLAGKCGRRYKFTTVASLDAVAAYFIAEGRNAKLTELAGPPSQMKEARMILFGRKMPHATMFVSLENHHGVTTGSVAIDTQGTGSCA